MTKPITSVGLSPAVEAAKAEMALGNLNQLMPNAERDSEIPPSNLDRLHEQNDIVLWVGMAKGVERKAELSRIVPGTDLTGWLWLGAERKSTAWHEAGHLVAHRHCKNPHAISYIWETESPPGRPGTMVLGSTIFQRMSGFRQAVAGWAGAIAEQLSRIPSDEWDDIDVVETVRMFPDEHGVSPSDMEVIDLPKTGYRAFQAAHKILCSRELELRYVAKHLQKQGSACVINGKYLFPQYGSQSEFEANMRAVVKSHCRPRHPH